MGSPYLFVYDVVVKKFTFATSSPVEFLVKTICHSLWSFQSSGTCNTLSVFFIDLAYNSYKKATQTTALIIRTV